MNSEENAYDRYDKRCRQRSGRRDFNRFTHVEGQSVDQRKHKSESAPRDAETGLYAQLRRPEPGQQVHADNRRDPAGGYDGESCAESALPRDDPGNRRRLQRTEIYDFPGDRENDGGT